MAARATQFGDFGSLRDGFDVLSEIYRLNGAASPGKKGITLSGIPRERWSDISRAVRANEDMIKGIIQGTGQRSSVQGRLEVVLAVIAVPGTVAIFEVTALLVMGRGAIRKTLTVRSSDTNWRQKLGDFTDWTKVEGVIPAAEGNNQRAMIGLVLQLAGIGRGKLEIIEADLPEEIDEAAQSVRGADWMKAGLLRFKSAAGEALFYLMRIRSVHARMIKVRKQGYYSSMALAAMHASGMTFSEMSAASSMPEGLVVKLTPKPGAQSTEQAAFEALGGPFAHLDLGGDEARAYCANRVWKGAAIYARVLDRRIRVGAEARRRIGEGDDIVSVAQDLRVPRRDLVRVLSVKQADAVAERERFVGAIIDPDLIRKAASEQETPK